MDARMLFQKTLIIGTDAATQHVTRQFSEQVYSADAVPDAWDILSRSQVDLTILDTTISFENACDLLASLQEKKVQFPVLVVAGADDKSAREKYLQFGAYDVLSGPDALSGLSLAAETLKSKARLRPHEPMVSIVGRSKASQSMISMIRTVARSNCNPVLIIGETGSGKEVAAQEIHSIRHGSVSPFVAINCAALTAGLLESELFGHVKGAFTGADRDKIGLFELAQNGTVFLDEISEMPLELQAKLLRVLQERRFRKVGGTREIECRATVIASSNRNLLKEARAGKFRQDLYYRLAVCPISIAPLRSPDRQEDISVLARHLLETQTICPEKSGRITGFTALAVEALQRYPWPGNVRELKNVVERAILLETTDKIGTSSLIFTPEVFDEPAPENIETPHDFSLERAEKELIAKALAQAKWQKSRAASMLGITRATLYAKVKQYDIKLPETEPAAAEA
jgi:DNA-binding NtrC family response regulator